MSLGRFIGAVGAVIYAPNRNRYLLLKRADHKDFAPGIWEHAAGRLNQGEGFEAALYRELDEELGVRPKLKSLLGTTHFFRGSPCPENELIGVLYLCELDSHTPLHLSAEHTEARWVDLDEARRLLQATDSSTQWTLRALERAERVQRQGSTGFASFNLDAN